MRIIQHGVPEVSPHGGKPSTEPAGVTVYFGDGKIVSERDQVTLGVDEALHLAAKIVSLLEYESPLTFAEILMLLDFPDKDIDVKDFVLGRWVRGK